MRKMWMVGVVMAALLATGCGGCGGDKAKVEGVGPVTPEDTPPVIEVIEPPTPSDPALAALAALSARAAELPPVGDDTRPPREAFRREALTLGNQAIEDVRLDVVTGVAGVLWAVGEVETAAAFLQRSVGMTRGKTTEKAHMHALARLKVELGVALEAASLMERAIDIEPTSPRDFELLSWAYLRAGRSGPAAAATRRGMRGHPDAPSLHLQNLEVMLAGGKAGDALGALEVTPEGADRLTQLRIMGEAQLVTGDREGAAATVAELTAEHPESPWGPLYLAALGGEDRAEALDRARTLAAGALEYCDARAALAWAEAAGAEVSPWSRARSGTP